MPTDDRALLMAFCDYIDPKRLDSKLMEEQIDAFLASRQPSGTPEELSCDGCGLVYGKAYPREPSVMVRPDGKARCNDCANGIKPQTTACQHPGCSKPAVTSLGNCTEHWGEDSDDTCPECRDRPGHIALNGQEVACGTCGRTYVTQGYSIVPGAPPPLPSCPSVFAEEATPPAPRSLCQDDPERRPHCQWSTPPTPQRYWRVWGTGTRRGESRFVAIQCNAKGRTANASRLSPESRPTRAEAVADGIASGLEPWRGGK